MEIYKLIPLIAKEIKPIKKNQTVSAGKSTYKARSAVDVFNAVSSIMASHGVFNTFEVLTNDRESITNKYGTEGIRSVTHFRFKFFASDASSVEIDQIGEAIDWGGDKCSNKCLTIAHRNALVSIFTIPFEGMDDPEVENHQEAQPKRKPPTPKPPTPKPPQEPSFPRETPDYKPEPEPSNDLSDYVMQKGANKGKKLGDIPKDKLQQWVSYMENSGFTSGQDFGFAKQHLEASIGVNPGDFNPDEELPF